MGVKNIQYLDLEHNNIKLRLTMVVLLLFEIDTSVDSILNIKKMCAKPKHYVLLCTLKNNSK